MKNFSNVKSLGADKFRGEWYQTFKDDIVLIHWKLFQDIAEERTIPN